MIEMINGKAYVKKGDKVYEVSGGGSNFIFANSKEELPDPSTVPENTVGLVPSEDDGGEGGGSAETAKIIDLTQYGNSHTTLNDICLALYASGGGVDELDNMAGTFMDDIDSSATIKIDATPLGYIIESDVKSIIKLTDGSTQTAETSFLAMTGEDISEYSIVTIVFHRGGQSVVAVLVSVEPLSIPS